MWPQPHLGKGRPQRGVNPLELRVPLLRAGKMPDPDHTKLTGAPGGDRRSATVPGKLRQTMDLSWEASPRPTIPWGKTQGIQGEAAPRLVPGLDPLQLHPHRDLTQWRRWRRWSWDSSLCWAAVAASSERTGCSWQLLKALRQAGVTRCPAQAWPWEGIFRLQITKPKGCTQRPGSRAGCPGPVPPVCGCSQAV